MTLLIKNVKLLGSDLGPEARSDVFVSGETISAIGDFSRKNADEVIDGQGGYLAPGFIDIDTTSDHYLSLFDNPGQEDFLKQGVTTIIGGHCGASLAPLLYGTLESLRKWADIDKINVDWHTMGEFLERLSRQPLGVNFATFAGHATIRRAMLGEDVRDLNKNELGVFVSVLERAMSEGALGLSTGLEYVHAKGTSYQELLLLAKAVRGSGAIYSTHLRSTNAGMVDAVRETLKLASESGASTLVSHFMPFLGFRKEYEEAAQLIEALPADADFHVDMHPWGGSMIPFYRLLPQWAQTGTLQIMAKGVKDEWMAKRILKELPEFSPEDFAIAEAPGQNILVGETLATFMQQYEIHDPRQALLKLLEVTGLRGVAYVQNVEREVADRMLAHPRTLIASHAPSLLRRPHEKLFASPRATDNFPEYLRRVTSKNLLSLPDAVKKITAVPAQKLQLAKRGWIREGYLADLALLKDLQVKTVVVNGTVAVRDGAATGARSGRPLLHRPS
jgi:N-acyl-D-aspartate/D-glutamate deacylase